MIVKGPNTSWLRTRSAITWLCLFMLGWCLIAVFLINNLYAIAPFAVGSAVVILLMRYWDDFIIRLKSVRKKWSGLILTNLIAFLMMFALLTGFTISVQMVFSANKRPYHSEPAGETTVILMGCRIFGEEPSRMLLRRMEAAVEFLLMHSQAVCVVSGGQGAGETTSEAECMKRYLISAGIAEARIFLEDRSTSTYENITWSAEIIREHGLFTKVAIATDIFHQFRSQSYARNEGFLPSAIVSRTYRSVLPFYWLREIVAVVADLPRIIPR